jgi:hypothetical protein
VHVFHQADHVSIRVDHVGIGYDMYSSAGFRDNTALAHHPYVQPRIWADLGVTELHNWVVPVGLLLDFLGFGSNDQTLTLSMILARTETRTPKRKRICLPAACYSIKD